MTDLFRNSSPGALTLQQSIEQEKKRRDERRRQIRQARELAAQGRGNDTEVAHVALGEIVLPKVLQTSNVLNAIRQAAQDANIPFDQLRIGSASNSINPETGMPEFGLLSGIGDWFSKTFGSKSAMADEASPTAPPKPYDYDGPEIEEITVTTPREQGLVQLPQDLPNSGFYSYGTPDNGAGQYGLPAAMEVIGAAGRAWQTSGAAPFGVGNMSLSDGSPFKPHSTKPPADHMKGVGIDLRPVRRDGRQEGVMWNSPDYDREATQKLVDTLHATGGVDNIFFNDPEIKGVSPSKGHDNHLHIRVNPLWKRF
jgi:hypothetical protein